MLTGILLLFLTLDSAAQEGLYAPSVPEDAALVRIINATSEPLTFDVGPLRYRDVPAYSASAYRPVQPGVFVLFHVGKREVLTPEARSFLTIALLPDDLTVIRDERHVDPARAQLVIYNFSEQPVSFEAVEPGAVLVPEVPSGESRARVVNAIAVRIAAVAEAPLYAESIELERGESYSMVVLGEGVEPAGFVHQADVSSE